MSDELKRRARPWTLLTAAALVIYRLPAPSAASDPTRAATPRNDRMHAKDGSDTGDATLIPAAIPDSSPQGIIPGGHGDRVVVIQDTGPVSREGVDGRTRWVAPLRGRVGLVRSPEVVTDADRAYVAHDGGITALNVGTGRVLWHSPGPADRMLLSGDLLLTADCKGGELVGGRWLIARKTVTGTEAFRVALPLKNFDANPILEEASLFVVQTNEDPDGVGDSFLIDRAGRVLHRLNRQVVALRAAGADWLVLTSRNLIRLAPDGPPRWTASFGQSEWVAGGGLVPLLGGDVVAYLYGRINDSGVQVLRINPVDGHKRWEVRCSGLGVDHSAYRHDAVLQENGGRLNVTSRGSAATFVEALDAQTGHSLGRRVLKR
jgi:hypothetical protein